MRRIWKVAMAACFLVLGTTAARATTVTIGFNDANGGDQSYTTPDGLFNFDPTKFNSGNCAPAPSGNGSCVSFDNKDIVTTMTRTDGGNFTLLSFYFDLLGNGTGEENSITVASNTGETSTFTLGDLFSWVRPEGGGAAEPIANNSGGYVVFFEDLLVNPFTDVTYIMWSSFEKAGVRFDDVTVSYSLASTAVPLPPAALLLLSALGGLAGVSRFKSKKLRGA